MPTIPSSQQSIDGLVRNQLDTTLYTWSDARDDTTGSSRIVNPTSMSPDAFEQTVRGQNWVVERCMLSFDFSGVSGTITSLHLKLYKSSGYTNYKTIIAVKNTNTWGSGLTAQLSTSDYTVDFNTPYSGNFNMGPGGAGTVKTVDLNSDAKTDAVGNSDFNIGLCDYSFDYSDTEPGLTLVTTAGFYYNNSSYYPRIEYTLDTGFGEIVNGVIAANINKILNVGRLNVKRVIDTPKGSTFTLAGVTGENDNVNVTSLINGSSAFGNVQPFVDPSGTRLYIPEHSNKKIRQLSMSSANNISSTISNVGVSSALTNSFTHFQMSADGTKAYIMYSNSVVQYTLSTAWDITTMATIGSTLNLLVPAGGLTRGMHFSPDGTQLIIMTIDTSPSQINLLKYTLSTAFNITTAGSPTTSDITSTGPGSPSATIGLCVIEDAGTLHYVVASSGNDDTRYEDGILNADFAEQTSLVYAAHVSCEYTSNYMYSLTRTGTTGNYTWTLYQHLTNI